MHTFYSIWHPIEMKEDGLYDVSNASVRKKTTKKTCNGPYACDKHISKKKNVSSSKCCASHLLFTPLNACTVKQFERKFSVWCRFKEIKWSKPSFSRSIQFIII